MAEMPELDLNEEIDNFAKEVNTKEGWSNEIDSLLHIVSIVNNNPNLPLDGISITNPDHINELKKITP